MSFGLQEDYDRVRVISYMKCDVFLVCFASDRRETLASVESHWIPEIRQYLPKVPYILVSTQIDKREDSYESVMNGFFYMYMYGFDSIYTVQI